MLDSKADRIEKTNPVKEGYIVHIAHPVISAANLFRWLFICEIDALLMIFVGILFIAVQVMRLSGFGRHPDKVIGVVVELVQKRFSVNVSASG